MFEEFEEFRNPKLFKPNTLQTRNSSNPKPVKTLFPPILPLFYINKFLNQFSYKAVASYVIIYNFAFGPK